MERFTRLAPSEAPAAQVAADTFRFVFSNEKVGRDGFVVLNKAIKHANYDRNNVALFAHDDKQPPIGRGINIDTSAANCTIDIQFVPRDILPFAGTIRDLVAGKWLRAVSLSWQPIEAKRSSDPDIAAIFTEVDMLEVSIVPLPALPDALLAARSHGVNIRPLGEWAERALDMPGYRGLPRTQLEAIYRSASPKRKTMSVNKQTARAERERRVRVALALQLQEGPAKRTAAATVQHSDEALQEVQGHCKRCLEHHAEIGRANETMGDGLDALAEVHKRMTSTLKDLGYGRSADSPKVVEDMARCMRSLTDAHEKATDAHGELGEALGDATGCVEDLMGDEEEG